ncbi:MAG: hypothetical protein QOJ20_1137, partial [Mycobacterium sp.]|nr:hypothetical protein [Mycobacterium sp.]
MAEIPSRAVGSESVDDLRVKLWIATVFSITLGVPVWLLSRNLHWVAIGFGIGIIIHLIYNMMTGSENLPWVIGNFGGIVAIFGIVAAVTLRDYNWGVGGMLVLLACFCNRELCQFVADRSLFFNLSRLSLVEAALDGVILARLWRRPILRSDCRRRSASGARW